jgi:hypothetical protein
VLGLRQFTERVGDGAGEPFLDADNGEELMHELHGVAVVLGNRAPESPGTLYVSSKYSLSLSLSLYIYIYICMCVCVLVKNLVPLHYSYIFDKYLWHYSYICVCFGRIMFGC